MTSIVTSEMTTKTQEWHEEEECQKHKKTSGCLKLPETNDYSWCLYDMKQNASEGNHIMKIIVLWKVYGAVEICLAWTKYFMGL